MKQTTKLGLLATSAIAAASLVACGGGGGSSTGPTPTPAQTSGTLAVSLTDAPACGFDQVNVTVNKVRVNKSATASDTDAGWTDITLSPAKKINLLDLSNGVVQALGQTVLDAGHYTQIRLVLDANASGTANTVVPTGSTAEKPLDTPSAVQSGIKLNGEFDVAAGQKSDIVLDFDACKSIVTRGNGSYALKPVIKMVPAAQNGIDGYVATSLLGSHVMVTAQQNGKIISTSAPNATTGEFYLSHLNAGNYDVVITADNSAASVIGAVPVTASAVTDVATAAAPIALATSTVGSISGTVTMTPPSTTAAAWVNAKQTFASGPTVVVKSAGADATTGAYTIDNLPIAAPQYVAYTATLPLVFTASTATTPGKYTVEATADGYTTKSVDGIDITTANQTGVDFSLAP